MVIAISYASLVTICHILFALNERIAYGLPRKVDYENELIVITGGSSGLGLLIAKVFAMKGASVVVLDVKDLDAGEAEGINFYHCDVGDRERVDEVAANIRKDLGDPTILINNAGIVNGQSILSLSANDITQNFSVNLLSHYYTIQSFLPRMLELHRGTIVTVSSVLGTLGASQLCDYAAAKAGLIAMHTSLSAELARARRSKEIKTLLVTPGQLSTDMFAGVQTPSGFFAPVVETKDVANAIVETVSKGCSGWIAMPFYAKCVAWMGVLPVGVQKFARWLSGIDTAMHGFETKKYL